MKEQVLFYPAGGIHILLPVYNEERRICHGVECLNRYFYQSGFVNYRITIVDNGSEDQTASLALALCKKYRKTDYLRIDTKGVGAAFRAGARISDKEILGYMDIDLSTDLRHINEVMNAFAVDQSLQMVYGSRWKKGAVTSGRKLYRQIASFWLRVLLRRYLSMKATDACCGFKFFRKKYADDLIKISSKENGWFFLNIELLARAEKRGDKLLEIPVEWHDDSDSKVDFFSTIHSYLKNMRWLKKDLSGKT